MSRSGRASEFMTTWALGQGARHNTGHQDWGADECAACVAETFDPWEALVHGAEIMGWIERGLAAASPVVQIGEQQ